MNPLDARAAAMDEESSDSFSDSSSDSDVVGPVALRPNASSHRKKRLVIDDPSSSDSDDESGYYTADDEDDDGDLLNVPLAALTLSSSSPLSLSSSLPRKPAAGNTCHHDDNQLGLLSSPNKTMTIATSTAKDDESNKEPTTMDNKEGRNCDERGRLVAGIPRVVSTPNRQSSIRSLKQNEHHYDDRSATSDLVDSPPLPHNHVDNVKGRRPVADNLDNGDQQPEALVTFSPTSSKQDDDTTTRFPSSRPTSDDHSKTPGEQDDYASSCTVMDGSLAAMNEDYLDKDEDYFDNDGRNSNRSDARFVDLLSASQENSSTSTVLLSSGTVDNAPSSRVLCDAVPPAEDNIISSTAIKDELEHGISSLEAPLAEFSPTRQDDTSTLLQHSSESSHQGDTTTVLDGMPMCENELDGDDGDDEWCDNNSEALVDSSPDRQSTSSFFAGAPQRAVDEASDDDNENNSDVLVDFSLEQDDDTSAVLNKDESSQQDDDTSPQVLGDSPMSEYESAKDDDDYESETPNEISPVLLDGATSDLHYSDAHTGESAIEDTAAVEGMLKQDEDDDSEAPDSWIHDYRRTVCHENEIPTIESTTNGNSGRDRSADEQRHDTSVDDSATSEVLFDGRLNENDGTSTVEREDEIKTLAPRPPDNDHYFDAIAGTSSERDDMSAVLYKDAELEIAGQQQTSATQDSRLVDMGSEHGAFHGKESNDSRSETLAVFTPEQNDWDTDLRRVDIPADELAVKDITQAFVQITLDEARGEDTDDASTVVPEDESDISAHSPLPDNLDALAGDVEAQSLTNGNSQLVDTSTDDDLGPTGTNMQEDSSVGSDPDALTDTSSEEDDTSTVVQEDRIKAPKRRVPPLLNDSDDSDDLADRSIEQEEAQASTVEESSEEDDTSTVVQEGRIKTPKHLVPPLLNDSDDSDDLTDSSIEEAQASTVSFLEEYDDCAWAIDKQSNEVFLSDENNGLPDASWPKLRLPMKLYQQLYCHQKVGVQWMASLHSRCIGGVLGDDMGMGKTYQTLALLGGLMRARTIRNALVVAPLSVLQSWEKEARLVIKRSCVSKVTIIVLSSDMSKYRRQRLLQDALSSTSRSPYLIITTYGLIQSSPTDFVSDRRGGKWDYVALDEGHKIKNQATQVHKACERICRHSETRRIMLTGTPIQNNLKELWALFDWAASGQLLGPHAKFVNVYARPIEEGRHKNASSPTIKTAELANNELQRILRPHFLQRMKSDFMADELPKKTELVVWTHISPKQRQMYEKYVHGEKVAEVLRGETKSPLEAITWLKKLCGHPVLVESTGEYNRATVVDCRRKEDLLRESAKLQVLISLLDRLRRSGHRTLIFSQSTRALDIMEKSLRGFRMSRIDGSTKGRDRQRFVEEFNSESSRKDVMLLSTKAAGLGLTLTGASRAIIYDPSWNPSEDAQAVDRCYRIGQRKEVTVYRLIAAGTVEEKMYEKQVHKDGIRRAVMTTSGNNTERYFDKKDLRKLFELAPEGKCEILDKIQTRKRQQPTASSAADKNFLKSHNGVVGVSSHDDIYLATDGNVLTENDEITAPFAGASANKPPRALGRAQKVLAGRKIDFSSNAENGGAGMKENAIAVTKRSRASAGSTSESAIDVDAATEETQERPPSETGIKALIDEADSLMGQGNQVGATSILLELVERDILKGQRKLFVHRKLAELGRNLGWLYNEATV